MKCRSILSTTLLMAMIASCAATEEDVNYVISDPENIECRRIQETGSNLGERICMEVQEWAEYDEQNRQEAAEFGRRMDQSPSNVGRADGGLSD